MFSHTFSSTFSPPNSYLYLTFLYEIIMWDGANIIAAKTNNIDLLITPLNIKTTDGIIESANALKTLFFFQQITHIAQ